MFDQCIFVESSPAVYHFFSVHVLYLVIYCLVQHKDMSNRVTNPVIWLYIH